MKATAKTPRECFADSRKGFVEYIQQLSTGDTSGKDVETIQNELGQIAHTLKNWTELHAPNAATCPCFLNRCSNLAEVIVELADVIIITDNKLQPMRMKMFNMLAMQIGRLTLDGNREGDEYALGWDQMAKEEDRRWNVHSQGKDDGRASFLLYLWTQLNGIMEVDPHCIHTQTC